MIPMIDFIIPLILLLIAYFDFKDRRIPNILVAPLYLLLMLRFYFVSESIYYVSRLFTVFAVISMSILIFISCFLFIRHGRVLGAGDVKLLVILPLFFVFQTIVFYLFFLMFLSFFFGSRSPDNNGAINYLIYADDNLPIGGFIALSLATAKSFVMVFGW